MNKYNPGMIVEDLLNNSDKEIDKIKTKIQYTKYTLTQRELSELSDIYRMLENKIALLIEQNSLIKSLYSILSTFKQQIIQREKLIAKEKKYKNIPDIEYIYVQYILNFLKEVHKTDNFDLNFSSSLI